MIWPVFSTVLPAGAVAMNPYSGPGPARMGASIMTLAGPTGETSAAGIGATFGSTVGSAATADAPEAASGGRDSPSVATGTGVPVLSSPGSVGVTTLSRAGSSTGTASFTGGSSSAGTGSATSPVSSPEAGSPVGDSSGAGDVSVA